MVRPCSSLKNGEQVVFKYFSEVLKRNTYEEGTVDFVDANNKNVSVSYLEGYKDRHDDIPFNRMVAVYNSSGKVMKFDHISGPSDLLGAY